MTPEISLLVTGLVFGLSGGLTPGPLSALILSQSLKYGIQEGVKIAIAPLLTDLPIILVALFLISRISEIDLLVGVVALSGGAYLAYLGCESLLFKGADLHADKAKPRSIQKGMITNILNPSPYLFWFTLGAPSVLKGMEQGVTPAVLFLIGLYLMLVGSKVLLAVVAGRSRDFLSSKHYIYTIRFLGLVLFFFAGRFLLEGIQAFQRA